MVCERTGVFTNMEDGKDPQAARIGLLSRPQGFDAAASFHGDPEPGSEADPRELHNHGIPRSSRVIGRDFGIGGGHDHHRRLPPAAIVGTGRPARPGLGRDGDLRADQHRRGQGGHRTSCPCTRGKSMAWRAGLVPRGSMAYIVMLLEKPTTKEVIFRKRRRSPPTTKGILGVVRGPPVSSWTSVQDPRPSAVDA